MLSTIVHQSFVQACKNDHLEVAQWLWGLCKDKSQQKEMLSDDDYGSFRFACEGGCLDVVEWLCSVCPDEDKHAMLSANDYGSFRFACEWGCLDVVEWLCNVCPDEDKQEMLSSVNSHMMDAPVSNLLARLRQDLDDAVDECNTAVVAGSFGRRI